MILLYSEILYSIYNFSAEVFNLMIYALAFYALLNFKFFKHEYGFIFVIIIGYTLFEFSSFFALKFGFNDNHFVNHPYSFFSLIVLGIWYSKILNNNIVNKIIVNVVLLFVLIDLYQIFTTKWPIESPHILPLSNFLFIYLSIKAHKKISASPKIKKLKNEPIFWFNFSFLIVNLSQLIMKPLFNAVIPISDDLAFIVGTAKNLYNPIFYLLIAIGIYKLKTQAFKPIASLWP